MEAERAWSYAMQLKQEANTEPRKRFHLLARLRKAAKHSEKLEKLCESPRVDAKTKLEAQVHRTEFIQYMYSEIVPSKIQKCFFQPFDASSPSTLATIFWWPFDTMYETK